MSFCQAARLVQRDLYEHDEGIDDVDSIHDEGQILQIFLQMKIKIRYALEDQSCLR